MEAKPVSESDRAVTNLRDYLKIRSVHPDINYAPCLEFLERQAREIGLPWEVHEVLPGKPVLVMTWTGTDPTLSSILLNSHMDVVPVFEDSWIHPPFEAHIEDGVIYGRGSQDMKSVAIQYLEAVRRLKTKGVQLKRTVHLSFVPDEEIGGLTGMYEFVKTDHFSKLNVGFALDEGLANDSDDFLVYNTERNIWHVRITCHGHAGHGSLLLPDNSGEKIRYIIDKFMDLRLEAKRKLADNPELTIGDVTTVNLTMLAGGIQNNVVPEKLSASFDVRFAPSTDQQQFENMLNRWCAEAGDNVVCEYEQKDSFVPATKVDETNPYWVAFKAALDKLGVRAKVLTFPGGTDSRFIRKTGVPALGFTPLRHTRVALHENNESISLQAFLEGIQVFESIISAVANV